MIVQHFDRSHGRPGVRAWESDVAKPDRLSTAVQERALGNVLGERDGSVQEMINAAIHAMSISDMVQSHMAYLRSRPLLQAVCIKMSFHHVCREEWRAPQQYSTAS
jgi:hypothetical protein